MTPWQDVSRPDPPEAVKRPPHPRLRDTLGPGLITGASDDDPSGIATYSQAGAQFGFVLGWTLLLSWPLMCAVQEVAARLGRVTGHGLAGLLRHHYPRPVVLALVGILALANVVNIGADLGAMGAALRLVVGGPAIAYVAGFAVLTVLLEVFVRYSRYVSVLKWLSLSLLSYVAVAFAVRVPWAAVAQGMIRPSLPAGGAAMLVAVLGTTISPYLFFWQAQTEVEDEKERPGARPLIRAPEQARGEFGRIRVDTWVGMGLSNLVALFILITAGATLHAAGVTDIETSAQAAEALRPIAGKLVFVVFALGIVGTGLLALPVLAGSAAFALGEAMGWHVGLARRPGRARAFYAVIAVATGLGALLNAVPLDPVRALVWSAVINGLAAPPVMAAMLRLARDPKVMGGFTVSGPLAALGWAATLAMAAAAAGLLWSWLP